MKPPSSVLSTAEAISVLFNSGILAQHFGVRQVFAACAVALGVLIVAGRLWMDPGESKPAPATGRICVATPPVSHDS